MIRENQRFFSALHAATDAALLFGGYSVSAWLYLRVIKNSPKNIALVRLGNPRTLVLPLCYTALCVLLLLFLGLYRPGRRHSFHKEFPRVFEANAMSLLSLGVILYVFRLQEFSRGTIALCYVISSFLLCAKRAVLRVVLQRARRSGYNLKHVLVVGTGRLARQYAEDIASMPETGIRVVGCLGAQRKGIKGYLGGFEALETQLHGPGIDEVIVALEPEEAGQIKPVILVCEQCGTKISVIPFYNDIIPTCPTIESIGHSKLINLRANPLDNMALAALKRGFDIAVSLVLLVVLFPLLLLSALLVRLSSPGPIFFKQERVGRNKKRFYMLKFRSMRVNAAEKTGWTTNGDPRKTRWGSFMRKFSIDELPQLINVLKGDMSLVGPRPEVPFYVEQFREQVPLYMVKHQVRPGMTGWAQVNGYRGDTSIVKRIEHDVWYIENWSIRLDLKILLMTAFGGFINRERIAEKDKREADKR